MNDLECTSLPEGLNLSSMASIGYFTVTNTSLNESGGTMPFQGSSVVTAVISLTVFVVGLLGNTLAIYVVLRYAKMKTVTNMYILNLALADELYILGIPFLTTQNVLSYWPYGEFLCRVIMTADTMNQFTSTYCLTVMSIDRYLAVVHPIRSAKWRRPQVAKVINAMVWVVSFLVGIPVIIFSDVQDKFHVCNMSWPEPHQDLWSTAFILYTSILGFFGPLLIICLCYLLIVIKVKSSGARAGLTKRRRSERKVTRMVVIIVVVFVLCWLPFFTTNIVNLVVIIPETSFIAGVYFFAVTLTYVNSCANPLLYGFLSENFKQSFQKVLCINKVNGVGDRDLGMGQPRTQKVVTHDTLLKPRRPHFNGHMQNNQCVQMESCGSVITERLPSETPVIGQPTL